jgi:hypothetical protein
VVDDLSSKLLCDQHPDTVPKTKMLAIARASTASEYIR